MTEAERKQIIALVQREVVPAIGCTEPIAVALCVAKATEALGAKPEKIDVLLSANILKNAMGVGIPGTGMIGLPIAIALGADRQVGVSVGSAERQQSCRRRRGKTLYRRKTHRYIAEEEYHGKALYRGVLQIRRE